MNYQIKNKNHLVGFIISLALTIVPFTAVLYLDINKKILTTLIIVCALIQIFVHLIFFIHLNNIKKQQWNFISLIFTILITFILITGSLWIMHHLNHNLMHH
ncbi:Cytochrome o ubiquinol oxidase protein CyoD [Blochmannia endosymbiont of Camponotus (Colobopsis) obliquus]|nr:Cytochrome o ubiquinol oxidase protein CyoD [Blochmannia endosymbiont of Camponotus (Colobopsis) obliquus]